MLRHLDFRFGWAMRLGFFLAFMYLLFWGLSLVIDQIPIDAPVTTECPS